MRNRDIKKIVLNLLVLVSLFIYFAFTKEMSFGSTQLILSVVLLWLGNIILNHYKRKKELTNTLLITKVSIATTLLGTVLLILNYYFNEENLTSVIIIVAIILLIQSIAKIIELQVNKTI